MEDRRDVRLPRQKNATRPARATEIAVRAVKVDADHLGGDALRRWVSVETQQPGPIVQGVAAGLRSTSHGGFEGGDSGAARRLAQLGGTGLGQRQHHLDALRDLILRGSPAPPQAPLPPPTPILPPPPHPLPTP